MRHAILGFLGLALVLGGPPRLVQAGREERTPFEMVRFIEDVVQVQLEGTWYELVELDGLSAQRVLAGALRLDATNPRRRFCEDLVASMAKAGRKLGATADLVLRAPGTKKKIRRHGVPATRENRKRIHEAQPWRSARRVTRSHATRATKGFAFLTIRHHEGADGPRLSAKEALEDLDELEWFVDNVFSYRDLRGFDWRAAFDTLRLGIGRKGITLKDFHIQLRKLVALFGDGHGAVRGVFRALPKALLPFTLADFDGKIVALRSRGKLLDAKHPFLRSIDGHPIAAWLQAAGRLGPHGSPQLRRADSLRYGGFVDFVRGELGHATGGLIRVALQSPSGSLRRLDLAAAEQPSAYGRARARKASTLRGGVGYVPIPSMESETKVVGAVIEQVRAHRKARGLILDIRGNPGGTRHILRALMPHLMRSNDAPVVVNVASFRLPAGAVFAPADDKLSDRGLHVPSWHGYTKAERAVATRELRGFRPDWTPGPKGFTPWHAMVVSPAPVGSWRFTKPVALLIDANSFSAADVFAGALERLRNVKLIGTATGGGSGRSKTYTLLNSSLRVKLSSMASFRPTGARYDGKGVPPDIEVVETLADHLAGRDTVLERALKELIR